VPLRAFCCKARGGGGRLRHATKREEREREAEREDIYRYIYCMLNTLTIIPFRENLSRGDFKVYREILTDVSRGSRLDLRALGSRVFLIMVVGG
jgi:hypothetical protein